MISYFVDTSFWLAYYFADETFHTDCQLTFLDIKNKDSVIFTSNFVIHETLTRLLTKTGWQNCKTFMKYIDKLSEDGELVITTIDPFLEEDSFTIFEKYHDHNFSFTDATIISSVRKHKIETLLTLDRGFSKIGIKTLPNRD